MKKQSNPYPPKDAVKPGPPPPPPKRIIDEDVHLVRAIKGFFKCL